MGLVENFRAAVAWTSSVCGLTLRYFAFMAVASGLFLGTNVVVASKSSKNATADFSGTWERYPDPYDPNTRFPTDPPPPAGGPKLQEPYAGKYKKFEQLRAAAMSEGRPLPNSSSLCLPEGMPTIMRAIHPMEILQAPHQLVVLQEFLTQTRRIFLNESLPPLEDISPSYNGYSVGHWDRGTLVVQTIGVREDVTFLDIPHTAQMKVTERLRLTGPDLLENQITIEDPSVLAKPYKFTFGYKRATDYRITEYICDANHSRLNAQGRMELDIAPK